MLDLLTNFDHVRMVNYKGLTMHRILMYADTTPEGLLQMEQDLTEPDGYTAAEPLLLNLDWVTWQLATRTEEGAWKVLYFLANHVTKVKLTAKD